MSFSKYTIRWKTVNWYHKQIFRSDSKVIYNWYNTTGTLVSDDQGRFENLGKFKYEDDVLDFIHKQGGMPEIVHIDFKRPTLESIQAMVKNK